jgi:hypothetical protein
MQSFGGSELNADGITRSTINRLDRLAPAQAARQFYREHPNLSPLAIDQNNIGLHGTTPCSSR